MTEWQKSLRTITLESAQIELVISPKESKTVLCSARMTAKSTKQKASNVR